MAPPVSHAASAGAKKSVIVFGGSGYLGRRVVFYALEKGYEVTSISRSGQAPYGFPDAWRVQWLSCDVTNRRAVEEVLQKINTPVDGVISTIGLLTLNRPAALQANGTANTNVIAALYNRQRLILKEKWDQEQDAKKEEKEVKKIATEKTPESLDKTPKTESKSATSSSSSSSSSTKSETSNNEYDFKTSSALDTKSTSSFSSSSKAVVDPKNNKKNALSTDSVPQFETVDAHLPFYKYVPSPVPEENKLPADLPPLTNHKSGIPRFTFISAASFGFPFTRILRAYYDGKISAERAMMDHCKGRGTILRPGAIYGTRYTASNVPIFLTPWFLPLEIIFSPLYKLTGIKWFQPPVSVDDVACAALESAMNDIELTEADLVKRYKIDAGYGHARGGVPNYVDRSRKEDFTPIFDHDGIVQLSRKFRK